MLKKTALIGTVLGVLLLAGSAAAMECAPGELPARLTVGIVDVNGNVFVKGTPGCAQSAAPGGRVRMLVLRMNFSGSGAANSTVIEVQPTLAEIEAR